MVHPLQIAECSCLNSEKVNSILKTKFDILGFDEMRQTL